MWLAPAVEVDGVEIVGEHFLELFGLGEEAVVAHVGDDRVQTEGVAEMLGEELLLVQGVQQVGVDSGHEHRDGDRGEGLLDPAALTSDVVAIDGVGEGDVCAGVEALEQLTGLVVEVALHGEASLRVAVGAERFLAFLRS